LYCDCNTLDRLTYWMPRPTVVLQLKMAFDATIHVVRWQFSRSRGKSFLVTITPICVRICENDRAPRYLIRDRDKIYGMRR
jgi:hypothetical protein